VYYIAAAESQQKQQQQQSIVVSFLIVAKDKFSLLSAATASPCSSFHHPLPPSTFYLVSHTSLSSIARMLEPTHTPSICVVLIVCVLVSEFLSLLEERKDTPHTLAVLIVHFHFCRFTKPVSCTHVSSFTQANGNFVRFGDDDDDDDDVQGAAFRGKWTTGLTER